MGRLGVHLPIGKTVAAGFLRTVSCLVSPMASNSPLPFEARPFPALANQASAIWLVVLLAAAPRLTGG